jgi:membrane protein implicated in regulation of membrane protease activity
LPGSSLIPFHRVLIATAIVFCAGLAWWMFSMSGGADSTPYGLLGAIFAILAVVLAVYLWNLRRVLGYRDDDGERGARR